MKSIAKFEVEFFDSGQFHSVTVKKGHKLMEVKGPKFEDNAEQRRPAISVLISQLGSLLREEVFRSDTMVYYVEKVEGGVKVRALGYPDELAETSKDK